MYTKLHKVLIGCRVLAIRPVLMHLTVKPYTIGIPKSHFLLIETKHIIFNTRRVFFQCRILTLPPPPPHHRISSQKHVRIQADLPSIAHSICEDSDLRKNSVWFQELVRAAWVGSTRYFFFQVAPKWSARG
jgi:hypothetical protein